MRIGILVCCTRWDERLPFVFPVFGADVVGVSIGESVGRAGIENIKRNFSGVPVVSLASLTRDSKPDLVLVLGPMKDSERGVLENSRVAFLEGPPARWLFRLLSYASLQDIILSTMQEGAQLVDQRGIIRYVNPAFTRITGIPPEERIGRSAFEVSPDGALVRALVTRAPVYGLRNKAVGSAREVVTNASPFFVGGRVAGAVAVFQDLDSMRAVAEALQQSNSVIAALSCELEQLRSPEYTFDDVIGQSQVMRRTVALARRLALSDSTVLIQGETGVGKEVFASAIHQESPRKKGPFVKVNCAAIPENLLESELFGYEQGSFTGAVRSKPGKFELANGGSILLDEVGELSLQAQAKLLRVLQTMEFERLGATKTVRVDVRVIASTNRNLRVQVKEGRFREDLYHRLTVLTLDIPPLRERKEDIPELACYYVRILNRRLGKRCKGLTQGALEALMTYDWPGNVRELGNVLERIMQTSDEEMISAQSVVPHLNPLSESCSPTVSPKVQRLAEMEAEVIRLALLQFGASTEGKRRAARALGISLGTLYNKMHRYNIRPPL